MECESNILNVIYKSITNNGISIISNVNDYIDQQFVISGLEIQNFQNIFKFYAFGLILIFLIFIINLLYRRFKNIIQIKCKLIWFGIQTLPKKLMDFVIRIFNKLIYC